jgi:hypothetical protein
MQTPFDMSPETPEYRKVAAKFEINRLFISIIDEYIAGTDEPPQRTLETRLLHGARIVPQSEFAEYRAMLVRLDGKLAAELQQYKVQKVKQHELVDQEQEQETDKQQAAQSASSEDPNGAGRRRRSPRKRKSDTKA